MANRDVCSSPIRIALNYMTVSLQFGRTPLMWASFAGHVECVQLLLDKGAQANHEDKVSEFFFSSSY